MISHPDADAFVREYLTRPTDVTLRLVFADWLEETGVPHNAAWAYFIRLRDEAEHYEPDSSERRELLRQADQYVPKIRAQLTIAASLFVGYPKSFLQLLPAPNITVRLANWEVSREVLELVPESVARENLVLPLDAQVRTLLIAAADPHDYDTAQKLEFILDRDIVFVGAERDDVQNAINRDYGQTETESVDSVLVEFADIEPNHFPYSSSLEPAPEISPPIVALVNLIPTEAINLGSDRILLYPDIETLSIRYRIDGEWVERDRAPIRLLNPVTTRLAIMGQIDPNRIFAQPFGMELLTGAFVIRVHGHRFRLRVTIQPSPDGPTTQLDITREPIENS
ncbi:type ii secretion system protein e : Type II secretion system protein E OS=Planctomyces limnophilus (strain ATCC 43296 / DSM 3776 / IFAM 1008 / 290) GN=Plim_0410 PE=4 SV=1: T2SE_Nter [Gemmata massiliana]|uniref:Type II secretion system protein GspE N-terminal domain-containing protein n=1 Tax=Gemmata massiliana TaxID=1210884 RepID=A0A6P2D3S6_9BACT|nr:TIGR02996 domain-containing protein [Gemmata massiliana]VTR95961.1 type ii secretion system protein e : Type II secretion system protein E OS=Planctomyces limnophilus (strain ATCC 43296 / DSM 3776 / IFAM 1008 / 290) GN=Plim_0410 PE=4 SV=1: T2SE_Nter [Gemmata massiliana]